MSQHRSFGDDERKSAMKVLLWHGNDRYVGYNRVSRFLLVDIDRSRSQRTP